MARDLLVKDLANDLVRETNVKKRIKEFLEKPVDQPRRFDPDMTNIITTASTLSFMPFPTVEPIEVTDLGDTERRFVPGVEYWMGRQPPGRMMIPPPGIRPTFMGEPIPGDREEADARMRQAEAGLRTGNMTLNEARALMGLNPDGSVRDRFEE